MEWLMLGGAVGSHVETLQCAADCYFLTTAPEDLSAKAEEFRELKVGRKCSSDPMKLRSPQKRRQSVKKKLYNLLDVIRLHRQGDLAAYVNEFEQREDKIAAVAEEMIDYIEKCEDERKLLPWQSRFRLVGDEPGFSHDLCDPEYFDKSESSESSTEESDPDSDTNCSEADADAEENTEKPPPSAQREVL